MMIRERSENVSFVRPAVLRVALLAMLAAAGHTMAVQHDWYWFFRGAVLADGTDYLLTSNNGAHAVGMADYSDKIWTGVIAAIDDPDAGYMEFVNFENGVRQSQVEPNYAYVGSAGGCVAYGSSRKHVLFYNWDYESQKESIVHCADDIDGINCNWDYSSELQHHVHQDEPQVNQAIVAQHWQDGQESDHDYVFATYWDSVYQNGNWEYGLHVRRSTDDGSTWETYSERLFANSNDDLGPTIAANKDVVLVARRRSNMIYVYRTTDHGVNWVSSESWNPSYHPDRPGLATCDDGPIFICWNDDRNQVLYYDWSTDNGQSWWSTSQQPAANPPFIDLRSDWNYRSPNIAMVYDGEEYNVILSCIAENTQGEVAVALCYARYDGSTWHWPRKKYPWFLAADGDVFGIDPDAVNPSVAALAPGSGHRLSTCVWGEDGTYNEVDGYSVYRHEAAWLPITVALPIAAADNVGRRMPGLLDGVAQFAACVGGNVCSGPVATPGVPPLYLVEAGHNPALALDAGGHNWVAFLRNDSVWSRDGKGRYECVFAGSSTAVPGQPSIVCYPSQANGVYVGNVVFPVYDTTGGTSRILYARVDTSAVVLDTIESVANLGDSLPCISVYKTDSLLVTWQHGDSTLAAMLCDYGPGTSGQAPAWSSPSLVSANGYHAMSRFDEGGSVLNVVWTRNNGSNYAIQRATCDLSTSLFGNWSQSATPGDTGAYEKSNPVFAGLGVTCWQQKDANGKWTIKGYVRGEETTLVANDTDAYHPHAVAESSAISPSIDQVRVHLLYTAGVTFEVDSGVFDTGDVRYVCESLSVSHACSDATKANNGAKLLRKNASDSLFSVYSDLDNAVVFAWSATGDTWQRSVMASGRDYPAIAEDSSGKRWVVTRKPSQTMNPPIQEAWYRNGSSWTGPETLYAVSGTTLGPASLSGSSYATSGIAYAAFLSTATGGTQSLILAKFNGSVVSTYTVATGTTLGDPALTVEPYKADSDHIHVTWADNGTIKYRMNTDGRSTSIASNWTSTYDLTGRGTVGQHPSINSDHDQIVVAWAQGDTTDIYCRERSSDSTYNNWESAANLSNTAGKFSDWPTIAMGDSVIIAWEERRSSTDYDILICVDFADTLNIADDSTKAGYPHVLFQTQDSTPYVHVIFCEEPQTSYYEVGYNKCDLKEAGEGQQSASSIPIPVKPSLASCSPNPFRSHTQISYALPTAGNVSLRVYDVTGRTVRTLASGHQKAGSYSVSWDARDSHGKQVPYGVYFYRLDTPGFRSVKKAVVTR